MTDENSWPTAIGAISPPEWLNQPEGAYDNDSRVVREETGYRLPAEDGDWLITPDDGVWKCWASHGEYAPTYYRTAEEAIATVIGAPE